MPSPRHSPPPSPPAFAENALNRPASTAPGRRSVASASGNDISGDPSFQSIEIVLEPPSCAASSRGSRTPSPVGPRLSAAIPIRPPTYFAPSSSAGKCFQEQIQPLAYFDVQPPLLFDHFGNPHLVAESASRYPGFVAPHTYGPPIPYYEVYPNVGYAPIPPPSPSRSSRAFDPPFALVQPPSPFAPHPQTFPSQAYEPTPYNSAWPTPSPYLDAPSPAFVSPPASPGLSDDGSAASAQQQAKPALAAIESTTGVVYPLVPSAACPVVPTVRELLARGEHFFSSGTCKFFDVLKVRLALSSLG